MVDRDEWEAGGVGQPFHEIHPDQQGADEPGGVGHRQGVDVRQGEPCLVQRPPSDAGDGFGMAAGLAFQLQDDLLNLVGNADAQGKDFRSDITEGKRTLMVVHALQNSPKRERLIEILSSKEKDPAVLAEAVDIMVESGSIEYARTYAENLTSIAKNRLVDLVEPSDSLKLLISMADWFVNRLK